jgi:hypothetical protein
MRPVMTISDCGTDVAKGVFHGWGFIYHESGQGSGSQSIAIVEFPDGGVREYEPRSIRFLDADESATYREKRDADLLSGKF